MARYANDTVCHIWASGNAASGQSHNGQLWFEDRALYSYGRHYCVGVTMPNNAVLLNSSKRSITTSRHCSYASRATSHMTRYYVPELEDIVGALTTDKRDELHNAAILRHMSKYALDMNASAACYLATCAGLSPSKALQAVKRARKVAQVAIDKRKLESDKRAKAEALEAASRLASYTQVDIDATIARAIERWNPIYELKQLCTVARRAHKAAKQARHNARAAKVWTYIKALDSARHKLEKRAAMRAGNATLSQSIVRLREAWTRFERSECEEWENRRIAQWAEYIAYNGKGLQQDSRDKLRAIASDANQRADTMAQLRHVKEYERQAQQRADWLAGTPGTGYWRGTDSLGGAMLRALHVERDASGTITDGVLETSQGASVPLLHAIRIFHIARQCRETGRTLEPKARVGHFTVDRIDSTGGFNAGCHRINWQEIERLATMLGIYP